MAETLIDLLRHGEPEGGVKFRGQRDDPLSASGWEQMRGATDSAGAWDVIITSPLRRCADFADELAARRDVPLETETRFLEMAFGAWEGLTAEQVTAHAPGVLERFRRDPARHAPPGSEPLVAFETRVAAGWDDLSTRHAGKRVLVICHGDVIRLILAQLLAMPSSHLFRLNVPFASASRVRVPGGQAQPELMFLAGRLE